MYDRAKYICSESVFFDIFPKRGEFLLFTKISGIKII